MRNLMATTGLIAVDHTAKPEESRRARLKRATRDIDWPALIGQILEDADCTCQDIADATGLNVSYLRSIKAEVSPFDTADRGIRLLSVFLLNTKRDLPLLGDHNDLGVVRREKNVEVDG